MYIFSSRYFFKITNLLKTLNWTRSSIFCVIGGGRYSTARGDDLHGATDQRRSQYSTGYTTWRSRIRLLRSSKLRPRAGVELCQRFEIVFSFSFMHRSWKTFKMTESKLQSKLILKSLEPFRLLWWLAFLGSFWVTE